MIGSKSEKIAKMIQELGERAKELRCIYKIDEILKDYNSSLDNIFGRVISAMHPGWQFVEFCKARIVYQEKEYTSPEFEKTKWSQRAQISLDKEVVGSIEVFYTGKVGDMRENPFLIEEQKLLETISERLAIYIYHRKLKQVFGKWSKAKKVLEELEQREGKILEIFRNADVTEIIEYLEHSEEHVKCPEELAMILTPHSEDHWKWRMKIAKIIAAKINPPQTGVQNIYIFGSTKNATAGPGSDIDLLIHFRGTEEQRSFLEAWLKGWSQCLAEINFFKTGYRTDELLDYHIITDEDIKNKTSYAIKINAVSDGARILEIGKKNRND